MHTEKPNTMHETSMNSEEMVFSIYSTKKAVSPSLRQRLTLIVVHYFNRQGRKYSVTINPHHNSNVIFINNCELL